MKLKNNLLMIIVGLVVIVIFLLYFLPLSNLDSAININSINLTTNESEQGIQVTNKGVRYLVNPDKLRGGGPPKGGIGIDRGIPALAEENIKFVGVADADEWIEDNELVLAINYKGVKKVYPLQILVWHEIVNDNIAGDDVLVTYCPLCGSGIAYERYVEVNGEKVKSRFGTSGKLFNSNLVMYDEKTDTYWQQIGGEAIVGELTGQKLVPIGIDTVVWRDYKIENSDAQVLSQDTGFRRNYGKDPYGNYYEDSFLFFPVENEDNRIHAKTVIFGIEVNGVFKAYREDDLILESVIEDVVGGEKIKLVRDESGIIEIKNIGTDEIIVKERDFWFAWYAFHPTTDLYVTEVR